MDGRVVVARPARLASLSKRRGGLQHVRFSRRAALGVPTHHPPPCRHAAATSPPHCRRRAQHSPATQAAQRRHVSARARSRGGVERRPWRRLLLRDAHHAPRRPAPRQSLPRRRLACARLRRGEQRDADATTCDGRGAGRGRETVRDAVACARRRLADAPARRPRRPTSRAAALAAVCRTASPHARRSRCAARFTPSPRPPTATASVDVARRIAADPRSPRLSPPLPPPSALGVYSTRRDCHHRPRCRRPPAPPPARPRRGTPRRRRAARCPRPRPSTLPLPLAAALGVFSPPVPPARAAAAAVAAAKSRRPCSRLSGRLALLHRRGVQWAASGASPVLAAAAEPSPPPLPPPLPPPSTLGVYSMADCRHRRPRRLCRPDPPPSPSPIHAAANARASPLPPKLPCAALSSLSPSLDRSTRAAISPGERRVAPLLRAVLAALSKHQRPRKRTGKVEMPLAEIEFSAPPRFLPSPPHLALPTRSAPSRL